MQKNTLLAIFAHPDDEMSCAGTLLKHSKKGDDVHLAFLTHGSNTTFIDGDADAISKKRMEHTRKIEKHLGVSVHFLNFKDSQVEVSVEGGYIIAELIKEIRPNAIITWNKMKFLGGGHPDHRNTSQLVVDAISYARYKRAESKFNPYRNNISLYQYYDDVSDPHAQLIYIDVSEEFDEIMKFIDIYQEAYGSWDIKSLANIKLETAGWKSNVKYAEVFQVFMRGYPAQDYLDLRNSSKLNSE